MKANKTHISLETAKLLKDCGVESEWGYYAEVYDNYSEYKLSNNPHFWKGQPNYPAYTWQEILWENAEKFFGEELLCYDCGEKVGEPLGNERIQIGTGICNCGRQFENNEEACEFHAKQMIWYLQQKKYEEVDLYFREHCILINKY